MADDDRYRWLDEEAAERLLRGSPVDAGGRTRRGRHKADPAGATAGAAAGAAERSGPSDAERLATALEVLEAEQTATRHALGAGYPKAPAEQPAELPGEEAALEAFRAAHADVLHSGTIDITAGPTDSGTVVGRRAVRDGRGRSGDRRPGAARRTSLAGRPLRAGFAMAVAGCALGGAAVAAGAGVLPTPFGGGGSPAASVSPMTSPDSADHEAAAGGESASPGDSHYPGRGGTSDDRSASSDVPDGGLAGSGRGHKGDNSRGPTGDNGKEKGTGKGRSEADKEAIAEKLCRDYEDQKLSLHDRLWLEHAAGGAAALHDFCAEHDGKGGHEGGAHSGGTSGSGGVGTPSDPGGTSDSGGDSGTDGGNGGKGNGGSTGHEDGGATGGAAAGGKDDQLRRSSSPSKSSDGGSAPSPSGSATPH